MKTKIYYVVDTMCGWSYGTSDVITKIEEKYKDIYDFNILPGGMWTGDNVKKTNIDMRNFMKGQNVEIEKLTGKCFGEGYNKNVLEGDSIVLDSFPGAKAVVTVQKLKKEVAFNFLKEIQDAFFIDGKDMNSIKVYTEIAKGFNIPSEEFEKEFNSEEIRQETFKCFDMANILGATTFPSIISEVGSNVTIKAQGYNSFMDLDKMFSSPDLANEYLNK
ncbi:DsbA family protein [Clostridium algoriphilum]|uniref:DsbA family protein n=1 Tax=Clostridium algoriphilum TaxID=198347 RepID=UPI001CF5535D|nr:DsbA family protein [Clostridium algoriphilum]MCB2292746.1 DsbA family protein [Clostridium algoriphilum]